MLELPQRVHLPAPSDTSPEKGALVSRSVQSDLFRALQDQLQRNEQISPAQTSKNHIAHPNHAIQPLRHACKRSGTSVSVAWRYEVAFKFLAVLA